MSGAVYLRVAVVLAVCVSCVPGQQAAGSPEQSDRVVDLRVTAVVDGSLYLDHGRDVGMQVGHRVRFFPPGGGEVEGVVRSLSHSSARAELPPGVPMPPVGTRGEATVAKQVERVATPRSSRPAPEHPPWRREIQARGTAQPLLVPTFGQRPAERPMQVDGRWFAFGQWNADRAEGFDSDYLLLRSGLRADVSNLLGTGERVRLAGEFRARQVLLRDAPDQRDFDARLDLASVAFGTEQYAPVGVEFGRFLSTHLPEIGLVDGVESVLRYRDGIRVGAGLGAYPRPFPARNAGDDLGVHAFVDYVSDPESTFAAAVGWQKTWHRGAPDRDLLLLRSQWRPSRAWSVQGNAKIDYYTGSDVVQGRGIELTELLVQGRWQGSRTGFGLTGSRFAWPELKRFEYQFLSPELIRDGAVDRIAAHASWRPSKSVSLRARADRFQDNARDGYSVRGTATVRGWLGSHSALVVTGFRNEGSFSSGPGASVMLRERLGDCQLQVGYRWHRYTLDRLTTGPETLVRQSAELRVSYPIGDRTDLDVTGEHWFGDGADAFAVSFYLQWRF